MGGRFGAPGGERLRGAARVCFGCRRAGNGGCSATVVGAPIRAAGRARAALLLSAFCGAKFPCGRRKPVNFAVVRAAWGGCRAVRGTDNGLWGLLVCALVVGPCGGVLCAGVRVALPLDR